MLRGADAVKPHRMGKSVPVPRAGSVAAEQKPRQTKRKQRQCGRIGQRDAVRGMGRAGKTKAGKDGTADLGGNAYDGCDSGV